MTASISIQEGQTSRRVTGRGADLIVLDDPQKPEEALSEAHRNSAGQWFDTTLLSRLDSKSEGAVVMVMQRLHEDDLAGRLLEKGGWEHLKIAAIAEQEERITVGRRRIQSFERRGSAKFTPLPPTKAENLGYCTAASATQCRSNPVFGRRLPKTGVFQMSAGDYRPFRSRNSENRSSETGG